MGKRRQETPDSLAIQRVFDALVARRKAEAQRQYAEAMAQIAAVREAVAQKLGNRRQEEDSRSGQATQHRGHCSRG